MFAPSYCPTVDVLDISDSGFAGFAFLEAPDCTVCTYCFHTCIKGTVLESLTVPSVSYPLVSKECFLGSSCSKFYWKTVIAPLVAAGCLTPDLKQKLRLLTDYWVLRNTIVKSHDLKIDLNNCKSHEFYKAIGAAEVYACSGCYHDLAYLGPFKHKFGLMSSSEKLAAVQRGSGLVCSFEKEPYTRAIANTIYHSDWNAFVAFANEFAMLDYTHEKGRFFQVSGTNATFCEACYNSYLRFGPPFITQRVIQVSHGACCQKNGFVVSPMGLFHYHWNEATFNSIIADISESTKHPPCEANTEYTSDMYRVSDNYDICAHCFMSGFGALLKVAHPNELRTVQAIPQSQARGMVCDANFLMSLAPRQGYANLQKFFKLLHSVYSPHSVFFDYLRETVDLEPCEFEKYNIKSKKAYQLHNGAGPQECYACEHCYITFIRDLPLAKQWKPLPEEMKKECFCFMAAPEIQQEWYKANLADYNCAGLVSLAKHLCWTVTLRSIARPLVGTPDEIPILSTLQNGLSSAVVANSKPVNLATEVYYENYFFSILKRQGDPSQLIRQYAKHTGALKNVSSLADVLQTSDRALLSLDLADVVLKNM